MTTDELTAAIDKLTADYQSLSDRLAAIDAKHDAPTAKLDGADGKALVAAIKAKHGLTAATLAELVGVSPRTVQGWQQGRPISIIAQRAMRSLE